MPSSLIPEKPLIFSPSLAATIGLEEAVMLQGLHEAMAYGKAEINDGYRWHRFEKRDLEQRFPFWNAGDVQRIANSLKAKGVVVLADENYLLTQSLSLALNEKVVAAVSHSSPNAPIILKTSPPVSSKIVAPKGRHKMFAEWQADKEIIKQMKQLGIPETYIAECQPEFVHYWLGRDEAHHGWGSKFRSWVTRQWREQETIFAGQLSAAQMSGQWQPDIDAIEILLRAGVEKQFIEEAIPEFVLYWRERGDSNSTWNSKFVQHIRLQWARYTNAISHESEPKMIATDWQPSAELFEVLTMANIDIAFAKQLIAEFILYWHETKQMNASWNSKFLQHVKYHWAKRHNMAMQSKDSMGFIERHTDDSWAKGL